MTGWTGWWMLAAALSAPGLSAAGRECRIGTDNTHPYHFIGPDGRPAGMAAEIVAEAARRLGITLKWEVRPEGPSAALLSGAVDLWPLLSVQPEMWPQLHFTRPYLNNVYIGLCRREEFETPQGRRRARRVAVLKYPLSRRLAAEAVPGAELSAQPTRAAAVAAVCRGDADLAFLEARAAQYLMLHRPSACDGVELHSTGMDVQPMHLALASRRDRARTADDLRSEIDRMLDDGTVQTFMLRWSYYYSGEAEALYKEEEAARANRLSWQLAGVLGLAFLVLLRLLWRMQEARQDAQEASHAKTQFLAMMSHEIRTPLHGLLGMAELLKETNLSGEQREFTDMIEHSGRALLELVNEALDLARVERGKMEIARRGYDPRRLFTAALKAWEAQARKKALELRSEGLETLPERAFGDEAKLRQVLTNLLANAVKFTPSGAVILRVEMQGERARVEVRDSGIGIAAENLGRIFEQFKQADGTIANRYGGTGLGLSIAKKLVELMGGRMGVESEFGVGTTFWFIVPMETRAAEGKEEGRGRRKRIREELPGATPVLVVEDNPVNQRIAEGLLSRAGCAVTTAGDGRAALDALRSQRFAAVFMDCQMPVMDGFETTRRIRESGNNVPVIALTASTLDEEQGRCRAAGMDDFLTKPLDMQELDRVLRKWVKGE